MFKKFFQLIVLLLACKICSSQNLVPNGNFEQFTNCPNALSNFTPTFWISPSKATPDYFNNCGSKSNVGVPSNIQGFQYGHSGVGYGGINTFPQPPYFPEGREYIEVQMTSPLIEGNTYHFEMYVSRANNSQFAVGDIGVYFSNSIIRGVDHWKVLPFKPQISYNEVILIDTLNWKLISGDYKAKGNELYLIIGNFNNDANTSHQLIDSNARWQFGYYFIDDVSLTDNTIVKQNIDTIDIYPNPFSDKLYVNCNTSDESELIIYDILSRKILQRTLSKSTTVYTEDFAAGVYIYVVRNSRGIIKKGKVIKQK